MRYRTIKYLFLILLPVSSSGQMQDDFSDGDFTINPAWSGDAGQFKVNTSGQLQLNSSGAGSSYLSTSLDLSSLDSVEWEFFIQLKFSPSANNYARVYLTSDQPDLKGALNGYYLQFGESLSNDAVELFRQTGTTSTSVCRGTNAEIANSFAIRVKVTRDNTGQWILAVDPDGGTNFIQEDTAFDATYPASNYFGVVSAYTSSNVANFYFDEFYAGAIVAPSPPQPVDSGSVIINEVLFSVKTGGAEYVEIYNNSNKQINLKDLRITKIDLKTLQIDSADLTATNNVLAPQDYMVLTKDPSAVKNQYYTSNPNAFLQTNLPDLLTNEDIIVLQDKSSHIIDQVHYYTSWHFPLLTDVHGVSLERLNPSRPSNDSTNWHSASETSGFGTPGYRNSQYEEAESNTNDITVEPEIFSPDNDGRDDIVNLHFHFNTPGYIANVKVFDSKGRPVRTLVANELIGNESSFSWDGINDKKEKARTGIYIFYVEVFDMKGNVKDYKKTCVLATRL